MKSVIAQIVDENNTQMLNVLAHKILHLYHEYCWVMNFFFFMDSLILQKIYLFYRQASAHRGSNGSMRYLNHFTC